MKRVAILQKYLAPYRIPLFNSIACHPDIDLTLIYYGEPEKRRKWAESLTAEKCFREHSPKKKVFSLSYVSNYEFPYALPRDLKRMNPDVIVCAPDVGGLCALWHTATTPSQYIVWSESTPATEQNAGHARSWFRKIVYRRAAGFIVPGRLAMEYIKQHDPKAPFFFANNSIDEDNFAVTQAEVKVKFRQKKKIITFSGSLIEDKGLHLLLGAFRRLLDSENGIRDKWTLRVLGAGPMDVSSFASDNVVFEGFCEGKKYRDYLKESHAFILPSFHDCNPLTVIEALFAGNIIVVTDKVGNHPESISGNGTLIGSHSEEEIFRALQFLVSLDTGSMVEMAMASLKLTPKFTTIRSAEGFIEAIVKS